MTKTWTIDPIHSELGFSVKHLMISSVKGRFTDFGGTVTLDLENPSEGTADVRIRAGSANTGVADRDAHLRSPDFFDAERFPEIRFQSSKVSRLPGGELELTGDLTIRDQTRRVTLRVLPEGTGRDMQGQVRAGFSATGMIRRSDFGMRFNPVLETGGVVVGDEVKLSLDVQLQEARALETAA